MSPTAEQARKIVHVDMDAFYASVEQRDRPELRGRPVVVAWHGNRSVVCAASYEARSFGIRSAMPAARARRLCPQAVFVAPDFPRYRAVSARIRAIFRRYTDLVEPLSLDEAYLDVTTNKRGIATATRLARDIRAEIREETGLPASAGVAPNKFLAKIASDWRKPDGLFVIQPHEVLDFLTPLPVRTLPGVGRATAAALARLDITTVGELRGCAREALELAFGKLGRRLHALARGVDDSEVRPSRVRKSLSVETTFETDRALAELAPVLDTLADKLWGQAQALPRRARTVVVKLKTQDFRLVTRSHTPARPPASEADVARTAQALLAKVALPARTRYRLAGVGLSNFADPGEATRQTELF